ncbi:hypothetical protein CVS40_1685 [Lucilia cuprina]|nr:hypothetical protein CVS40_1685 [Lucilia cuprina]
MRTNIQTLFVGDNPLDNKKAEDIRFRINKGRAAFNSLEKIWRSTYITRNTKIKILNTSIKSVANTIFNTALWTATQQEPISLEIRRSKWMWIDHTLRKPQDDIARTALGWKPQGSRRRSRTANMWRRLVDAEAL